MVDSIDFVLEVMQSQRRPNLNAEHRQSLDREIRLFLSLSEELHRTSDAEEAFQQLVQELYPASPTSHSADLRAAWEHPLGDDGVWEEVVVDLMNFAAEALQALKRPIMSVERGNGLKAAALSVLDLLDGPSRAVSACGRDPERASNRVHVREAGGGAGATGPAPRPAAGRGRGVAGNGPEEGSSGRMLVDKGRFHAFQAQRFQFAEDPPEPLREWLSTLVVKDPQKRFRESQMEQLIRRWEEKLVQMQSITSPQDVLQMVIDGEQKGGTVVADRVKQDVLCLPVQEIAPEHLLALVAYRWLSSAWAAWRCLQDD